MGGAQDRVSTSVLAEHLEVAPPSVSTMLKRLSQKTPPLVDYASHHGATLTEVGRRESLKVIRHHRLVETFLFQVLDYSWDEVHEEAELLEHYISERLEDRIATFLGHPEYDPHGAPIPTKDGHIPIDKYVSLDVVNEGLSARVMRVDDGDGERLRYLKSLGLVPDAEVHITKIAPFDGPIHICVGCAESGIHHAIGSSIAKSVMVEAMEG
jgi:DtxR family Mn-dependent transcriptional regulator